MRRILPVLLACTAAALSPTASAQSVQRCMGPDGRAVYTDRRCDDIGAVQRLPPATPSQGARLVRGGCPRLLSQLVGEIGAAIQARDVNRLSAVYDWRGVSGVAATQLFDRLEAMTERPLVDIAPVYHDNAPPATGPAQTAPDPLPMHPAATGPAAWMPSWRQAPAIATGAAGAAPDPASLPAAAPSRPYPVALRIEQTLAGGNTPARTVFGLHRAYGCFWIAL